MINLPTLTVSPPALNPPTLTWSLTVISPENAIQSDPLPYPHLTWAYSKEDIGKAITNRKLERAVTNAVDSPNIRFSACNLCVAVKTLSIPKCRTDRSDKIYRTSTVDCLISWMCVGFLVGTRRLAVGPNGIKEAREKAEDLSSRWKGIGCERQKILEAGKYSYVNDRGR